MHIPSYQIHNILKDFTRQLKSRRRSKAEGANQKIISPGAFSGPTDLRRTAVVSKVANKIMQRIAGLKKEVENGEAAERPQWSGEADAGVKLEPAAFDYYRWDPQKKGKVKQRLLIKGSRMLVQRFQSLTATGKDNQEAGR